MIIIVSRQRGIRRNRQDKPLEEIDTGDLFLDLRQGIAMADLVAVMDGDRVSILKELTGTFHDSIISAEGFASLLTRYLNDITPTPYR